MNQNAFPTIGIAELGEHAKRRLNHTNPQTIGNINLTLCILYNLMCEEKVVQVIAKLSFRHQRFSSQWRIRSDDQPPKEQLLERSPKNTSITLE